MNLLSTLGLLDLAASNRLIRREGNDIFVYRAAGTRQLSILKVGIVKIS